MDRPAIGLGPAHVGGLILGARPQAEALVSSPTLDREFTIEDEERRIAQALDAEGYNRKSLYNYFGFKPARTELSQAPVTISGRLPADLTGVYLRNGTNPQFERLSARWHMFDGPGMLHQVQIADGAATYSNTYVRTPRFEFESAAGREVFMTFGEMAGGGKAALEKMALVERKRAEGLIPDLRLDATQTSTAVQFHHDRIFCLSEGGYPFAVSAQKTNQGLVLDGTGRFETWDGRLRSAISAHPAIDPETGDFYSITVSAAAGTVDAAHVSGGVLVRTKVLHQQEPKSKMAWMHECALTENYLLFPDISMRFDPGGLLGPEGSIVRFDPGYKLRWGLAPRDLSSSEEVRWFETGRAGSIWHLVNAWEETRADGGVQVVIYGSLFDSYPADVPIHTPAETHAHLTKWVLDLKTGKVIEDVKLLDWGYERTSFNVSYRGRPNRYAYLLDEQRQGYMGKGVLKYDLLEEREVKYFDYGEFFGGEALFVPRKGATDEDDGYLLDLLMTDTKAELIVIDARAMEELARLRLPQPVPFGVHACWLDEDKLAALAETSA
jgi:carotenoid cleavage dioxygenase